MISLANRLILARRGGDHAWVPGLPHVVMAGAAAPVLGVPACVTGLLMATLASFIVYVPLTVLALNGGAPLAEDADVPDLSLSARIILLVLWTSTAWGAALIAR